MEFEGFDSGCLFPELNSELSWSVSSPKTCVFCRKGEGVESVLGSLTRFGQSADIDAGSLYAELQAANSHGASCSAEPIQVAESVGPLSELAFGSVEPLSLADILDNDEGIWAHHCCAVWSFDVQGEEGVDPLNGMAPLSFADRAAIRAAFRRCAYCSRFGASVECHVQQCTRCYHYPCAIMVGAFQHLANQIVLCPEHSGLTTLQLLDITRVCFACSSLDDLDILCYCTSCGQNYHRDCACPSMKLTPEHRLSWLCPTCKVCSQCLMSAGEDRRTCSRCDHAYHSSCIIEEGVNLESGWLCKDCLKCRDCDQAFTIENSTDVCQRCSKVRSLGHTCTVCQGALLPCPYKGITVCMGCLQWMHQSCVRCLLADGCRCSACLLLPSPSSHAGTSWPNASQAPLLLALTDTKVKPPALLGRTPEGPIQTSHGDPSTAICKVEPEGLSETPSNSLTAAGILPRIPHQLQQTGDGDHDDTVLSDGNSPCNKSVRTKLALKVGMAPKLRGMAVVKKKGRGRPSRLRQQLSPDFDDDNHIQHRNLLADPNHTANYKTTMAIFVSSRDSFILNRDICICGSVGKGDEALLVSCSQCGQCFHKFCLDHKVTSSALRRIVQYGYRCLECTVCEGCGRNDDEALLMLCDTCDTSYHAYCLKPPLENVPEDRWICKKCTSCEKCGEQLTEGPLHRLSDHPVCGKCLSEVLCPVCNKEYDEGELVITCQHCSRTVHGRCDSISTDDEAAVASELSYNCPTCRAVTKNNVAILAVEKRRFNKISRNQLTKPLPELPLKTYHESDPQLGGSPLNQTSRVVSVSDMKAVLKNRGKVVSESSLASVALTNLGFRFMRSLSGRLYTRTRPKAGKSELLDKTSELLDPLSLQPPVDDDAYPSMLDEALPVATQPKGYRQTTVTPLCDFLPTRESFFVNITASANIEPSLDSVNSLKLPYPSTLQKRARSSRRAAGVVDITPQPPDLASKRPNPVLEMAVPSAPTVPVQEDRFPSSEQTLAGSNPPTAATDTPLLPLSLTVNNSLVSKGVQSVPMTTVAESAYRTSSTNSSNLQGSGETSTLDDSLADPAMIFNNINIIRGTMPSTKMDCPLDAMAWMTRNVTSSQAEDSGRLLAVQQPPRSKTETTPTYNHLELLERTCESAFKSESGGTGQCGLQTGTSLDGRVPLSSPPVYSEPSVLHDRDQGSDSPLDSVVDVNRHSAKWFEEEKLGAEATTAAVLYANICQPGLKNQYPAWSERVRAIARVWKRTDNEIKLDYKAQAKKNRSAMMKKLKNMKKEICPNSPNTDPRVGPVPSVTSALPVSRSAALPDMVQSASPSVSVAPSPAAGLYPDHVFPHPTSLPDPSFSPYSTPLIAKDTAAAAAAAAAASDQITSSGSTATSFRLSAQTDFVYNKAMQGWMLLNTKDPLVEKMFLEKLQEDTNSQYLSLRSVLQSATWQSSVEEIAHRLQNHWQASMGWLEAKTQFLAALGSLGQNGSVFIERVLPEVVSEEQHQQRLMLLCHYQVAHRKAVSQKLKTFIESHIGLMQSLFQLGVLASNYMLDIPELIKLVQLVEQMVNSPKPDSIHQAFIDELRQLVTHRPSVVVVCKFVDSYTREMLSFFVDFSTVQMVTAVAAGHAKGQAQDSFRNQTYSQQVPTPPGQQIFFQPPRQHVVLADGKGVVSTTLEMTPSTTVTSPCSRRNSSGWLRSTPRPASTSPRSPCLVNPDQAPSRPNSSFASNSIQLPLSTPSSSGDVPWSIRSPQSFPNASVGFDVADEQQSSLAMTQTPQLADLAMWTNLRKRISQESSVPPANNYLGVVMSPPVGNNANLHPAVTIEIPNKTNWWDAAQDSYLPSSVGPGVDVPATVFPLNLPVDGITAVQQDASVPSWPLGYSDPAPVMGGLPPGVAPTLLHYLQLLEHQLSQRYKHMRQQLDLQYSIQSGQLQQPAHANYLNSEYGYRCQNLWNEYSFHLKQLRLTVLAQGQAGTVFNAGSTVVRSPANPPLLNNDPRHSVIHATYQNWVNSLSREERDRLLARNSKLVNAEPSACGQENSILQNYSNKKTKSKKGRVDVNHNAATTERTTDAPSLQKLDSAITVPTFMVGLQSSVDPLSQQAGSSLSDPISNPTAHRMTPRSSRTTAMINRTLSTTDGVCHPFLGQDTDRSSSQTPLVRSLSRDSTVSQVESDQLVEQTVARLPPPPEGCFSMFPDAVVSRCSFLVVGEKFSPAHLANADMASFSAAMEDTDEYLLNLSGCTSVANGISRSHDEEQSSLREEVCTNGAGSPSAQRDSTMVDLEITFQGSSFVLPAMQRLQDVISVTGLRFSMEPLGELSQISPSSSGITMDRYSPSTITAITRATADSRNETPMLEADSLLPPLGSSKGLGSTLLAHDGPVNVPEQANRSSVSGPKTNSATTAGAMSTGSDNRDLTPRCSSTWRRRSSKDLRLSTLIQSLQVTDVELIQQSTFIVTTGPGVMDTRTCELCSGQGDGEPERESRLVNTDVGKWVHLNCILWSNEVYELMNGSLSNVQEAIGRGLKTQCSRCLRNGATLFCQERSGLEQCLLSYHFCCAMDDGAVFLDNKTMFCKHHRETVSEARQLKCLALPRRIYCLRDVTQMVARLLKMNNDCAGSFFIRAGSLVVHDFGQLHPFSIVTADRFPVVCPFGYEISRFFWSSTQLGKRTVYRGGVECTDGELTLCLQERLSSRVIRGRLPQQVWDQVTAEVHRLRRTSQSQEFPLHVSGDAMFGFTDSIVAQVINSMPGLDVGRTNPLGGPRCLEITAQLPLAINTSGCVRAKPFVRTQVERPHMLRTAGDLSVTSSSRLEALDEESVLHLLRNAPFKAAQYRKMKADWKHTVQIARSTIQGLGLFAIKDTDANVMVIEYIGLLIRNEVADRKEKEYARAKRGVYMFRLNSEFIVDATICGGVARYINHSCSPNCFAEIITIDRTPKIVIISKRKIDKGEELTYDYKFDLEDEQSKIPCMCGAPNCRKWMN